MEDSSRINSVQFIINEQKERLLGRSTRSQVSSTVGLPSDIIAAKAKKVFSQVDSVLKKLADEEEAYAASKRPSYAPSTPRNSNDTTVLPIIPVAHRRKTTTASLPRRLDNSLPLITEHLDGTPTFASKQLQSANTDYVRSHSISSPVIPPPEEPTANNNLPNVDQSQNYGQTGTQAVAQFAPSNQTERNFRQIAAERRRIAAEAQRLKHAETCPRCARRSKIGDQFLEIKEKTRVARQAGGIRPPTTPRSRPTTGPSCLSTQKSISNSTFEATFPSGSDSDSLTPQGTMRRRILPGSDEKYHNCRHHSTDRSYRRYGATSSDNESCCRGHHGHRSAEGSPLDGDSPRRPTIAESLASSSPTKNSFYDRFGNRHRLLSPAERAERAERRRNNFKDNYTCCKRIGCAGYMGETGGIFFIDKDGKRHEHCPHRRSRHAAEVEGQDPDVSVSSHSSEGLGSNDEGQIDASNMYSKNVWRRISLAAAKTKSMSPDDISDGPHVNVRKYTGAVSGTFGKSKRFSYTGYVNEPVSKRRMRGRRSSSSDSSESFDSRESWDGTTDIERKRPRQVHKTTRDYQRRSGESYDDGRMKSQKQRSPTVRPNSRGRQPSRFGWSKTTGRSPTRKPPRLTPAQERRQARLHQSQWEKDKLAREARLNRKRLAKEKELADQLAKQQEIEEAERLEKERLLAEWEADQARRHYAEQIDRRHFKQEYLNRVETHKTTRPGLEKKLATLSDQLAAAPEANGAVIKDLEERIAARKAMLAAAATASAEAREAANGARRLIFECGDECEALLKHIRAARIDQITSFVGKGTTSLLPLRDLLVSDAIDAPSSIVPSKPLKGEFEDIDAAEIFQMEKANTTTRNGQGKDSSASADERSKPNKWKLAATPLSDIADEIKSRFGALTIESGDDKEHPLNQNRSLSRASTILKDDLRSGHLVAKSNAKNNINADNTGVHAVPVHITAAKKKCLRLGHEWALAFLEAADLVALRDGKCPMCVQEEEEEAYNLACPQDHQRLPQTPPRLLLEPATQPTAVSNTEIRKSIAQFKPSQSDSHRTSLTARSTLTAAAPNASRSCSSDSDSSSSTTSRSSCASGSSRKKERIAAQHTHLGVDSPGTFISINVGDQTAPPTSLAAPATNQKHAIENSLSNSLIGLLSEGQVPPSGENAKSKKRRSNPKHRQPSTLIPTREDINRKVAAIVAAAAQTNLIDPFTASNQIDKKKTNQGESPKKSARKASRFSVSKNVDKDEESSLNTSNRNSNFLEGNTSALPTTALLASETLAPYRRQVLKALVFEAAKSREEFERWKVVGEHAAHNLRSMEAVTKAIRRDEKMRRDIGLDVDPETYRQSGKILEAADTLTRKASESQFSLDSPLEKKLSTSPSLKNMTFALSTNQQLDHQLTTENQTPKQHQMTLKARSIVEAIRDINDKITNSTSSRQLKIDDNVNVWAETYPSQKREISYLPRPGSPGRGPAYQRIQKLGSEIKKMEQTKNDSITRPQPPRTTKQLRPIPLRIREQPLRESMNGPINALRAAIDD